VGPAGTPLNDSAARRFEFFAGENVAGDVVDAATYVGDKINGAVVNPADEAWKTPDIVDVEKELGMGVTAL